MDFIFPLYSLGINLLMPQSRPDSNVRPSKPEVFTLTTQSSREFVLAQFGETSWLQWLDSVFQNIASISWDDSGNISLIDFENRPKCKLSRGAVAQSVERPSKGPGSLPLFWREFKARPRNKVVGKIVHCKINPCCANCVQNADKSSRIGGKNTSWSVFPNFWSP